MLIPYNLADDTISVYIHWPFCLSKCPYCDFNSHVATEVNTDNWSFAFAKIINYFSPLLSKKKIASIFFGGGTPSLMEPILVKSIIDLLHSIADFNSDIEITLEANPTSIEIKNLEAFYNAGVNRVSIGVQSLRPNNLQFLGRTYDVQSAKYAINLAKSIFPRISFDLIYALPQQTLGQWQQELTEAMALADSHISLYQLTIEKGTNFYSRYLKGKLCIPNDDTAYELYNYTNNHLKGLGYNCYEVSNYSKSGAECRHNLNYWHYGSYLGIGPGAHSRVVCYDRNQLKVKAMTMYYNPQKWLHSILTGNNAMQSIETLSTDEIIKEIIIMGLRLSTGITQERLLKLTGYRFKQILNSQKLNKLCDEGYVVVSNNSIKLTSKGMLVCNYIINNIIMH